MSLEGDVRDWTTRACALVDGVPLDYIAIHVQAAAKSWPEHASVRVESRRAEDVVTEVLGHVSDVTESAAAEGRNGVAFRIKLYRAKNNAGTRTFRTAGGPLGSDLDTEEGETVKEATVQVIRELRLLCASTTAELASQSSQGWRLAGELAKENAKLTMQLANSRIEAQLSAPPPPDDGMKMAMELLPQLPGILANLAALARVREQARAEADPS